MSLKGKQALFVKEYLIDLNATAAYRRAGYKGKGADVSGPRLLGNARIAAAVKEAMEKRSQRVESTSDKIVRHLWIEAERQGEGASHSARVAALALLAKHDGMLIDRVKVEEGSELVLTRKIIHATDRKNDQSPSETS